MTNEMLEQLSENIFEHAFMIETFSDLDAANRWLLSQDRIKVTAFQIETGHTRRIGKLWIRGVLIAYQELDEPGEYRYRIAEGLEYNYDESEIRPSIAMLWKQDHPDHPYVCDQEEFVKGFRTCHRKYYVLYKIPAEEVGDPETVPNLFRGENHRGRAQARFYRMMNAAVVLAVLFTGFFLLGHLNILVVPVSALQWAGTLMWVQDVILALFWIAGTVDKIRYRKNP
ncbi:MAG: hypothetical protein IJ133_02500 [Clostridia bacterium]|nr:hypothetical protein [Clostridia bacterium]